MDIRDTKARLRHTFHYPTDDSSNGTPEVLDEEEQENLIQTLTESNAQHNSQFQRLLLALPLLSSIPYLLALFRPSTFLVGLLGLTSLASTAYILYTLPPTDTGIAVLDAWAQQPPPHPGASSSAVEGDGAGAGAGAGSSALSGEGSTEISGIAARRRKQRQRASSFGFLADGQQPKSPLEAHLPYLNLGLCAVLVLYGLLVRSGADGHRFGWLGLGNLPAAVYGVAIAAKVVMAGVDPERELGGLRYEYKGA